MSQLVSELVQLTSVRKRIFLSAEKVGLHFCRILADELNVDFLHFK